LPFDGQGLCHNVVPMPGKGLFDTRGARHAQDNAVGDLQAGLFASILDRANDLARKALVDQFGVVSSSARYPESSAQA